MSVLIGGESSRGASAGRLRTEWQSRQGEFAQRLLALGEQTGCLLGTEHAPTVPSDSPIRAAEMISEISRKCIHRLRNLNGADTEAEQRLCNLLLELQQLAMDLYLFETSVRSQRLSDCAASLNRLRAMPTSTALIDHACDELVFRCGFHRAVLSTVDARGWKPLVLFDRTEAANRTWFAAWQNQTVPLISETPEAVALVHRRPTLIQDTSHAPVYRPLIVQAGQSRSYVVAPLVQGDDVIGFLHTDHYPESRQVDEADRDVLWMFADGFSHIYQRAALMENLRDQRENVRDLFMGTVDQIDDLCEMSVEASIRPNESRYGAENNGLQRSDERKVELTERESEVLRLMVTGASNHDIADQLVITEGTVKSHVKHILRKYGAVNRAQAIAWALQHS